MLAESALTLFADAVGSDAVLSSADELEPYRDPYPFGDPDEMAAAAAVRPASVEEVQAVVRLANELGTPLWPVSGGKNLGYGGASPRVRGSVVLDLGRMNRVLEVSEEQGYALVEPGVRFFDLYQHLRAGGYRLWASVPDLGWGSVVGNALERGLGYTPYGEHYSTQCGMEVVLPNGDVVRTGMGAMTNSASWQLYKPGYGPSPDGLFMQSSLGVVTKMGVWLMPTPECFAACDVKVARFEDLGPLVDALRPLRLDGTIQSTAFIGEALGAAAFGSPRSAWYDGDGPVPEAVVQEVMAKLGVGRWTLFFGLYGSEEMVEARLATVRRAFSVIPGAEALASTYPGDAAEEDVAPFHRTRAGIPGMYSLQLIDWRGGPGKGGHVGFSPVAPLSGEHAEKISSLFRRRIEEYGFDYMGAFHAGPRHLNHIVELCWDRTDADEVARMRELFTVLVREAAAEGYGEYRTHLAFMDLVAEQFDWNDHALRRFNETLKDALDPNGILAPGKQGIWPERLRRSPASPARPLAGP
jgi:4-cresol dehydrogenase (hydroxylating)